MAKGCGIVGLGMGTVWGPERGKEESTLLACFAFSVSSVYSVLSQTLIWYPTVSTFSMAHPEADSESVPFVRFSLESLL